ncbi:MAG: class I SAM-dependent DNA methyltransferase [Planctomycetota bacterium]|nr:class I SAM-dependent DNA methyltransferase [Planctomycetota bacterium]
MITGELKSKVDVLWEKFWTGGITNPLTVIEQISYLMFICHLDKTERKNEKKLKRGKKKNSKVKLIYKETEQELRWSQFQHVSGEKMLPLVRDKVFPHMRQVGAEGSTFGEYMKDAQFMVQSHTVLSEAVSLIDQILNPKTKPGEEEGKKDNNGDLYEYLLSKLTTAGINGQFRTPRHIIRMMVEIADPSADDVIADPACGTAGFLVSARQYLDEKYTSKSKDSYPGDLLVPFKDHVDNELLHGFEFDSTMLRIASMNLLLHDVTNPNIYYQDSLNKNFEEGDYSGYLDDTFSVILANPPFKGSLDYDSVQPKLIKKVKTKKTELLFLVLMLRMLQVGGRCAVVVPDGVLFGSSKAHKGLRKMLVEDNQLDAVISLPSGVFKPYAGVSTAILYFTKGGRTDNVWFYDLKADGLSLDDKRDKVEENDIPDCLEKWKNRNPKKDKDRKAKAFFVPKKEIVDEGYDLSINRYKEIEYEEIEYDPPKKIIKSLLTLEKECIKDLEELEAMLG